MNRYPSPEAHIPVESAETQLQHLIIEHLRQKDQLFRSVNTLVAQLHHTQQLLETNRTNEALLSIEHLVHYGETLTRQL